MARRPSGFTAGASICLKPLDELGLNRTQGGIVFGISSLVGGLVSPLIGLGFGMAFISQAATFA